MGIDKSFINFLNPFLSLFAPLLETNLTISGYELLDPECVFLTFHLIKMLVEISLTV